MNQQDLGWDVQVRVCVCLCVYESSQCGGCPCNMILIKNIVRAGEVTKLYFALHT